MDKFIIFPVDKIEKGSNVVIYAAGDVGKLMLKQIEVLEYCHVVCFADANAEIKSVGRYKCVLPQEIPNLEFDYILVAKRQASAVEAIKRMLMETLCIGREKIALLEDKYCLEGYEEKKATPADVNWKLYYQEAERSAGTQYENILKPYLDKYIKDRDITIMDFACGEGRIVNQIRDKYKCIVCCDLPKGPLETCRERFKELSNILYVPSTEKGIELAPDKCHALYSWDAMVHFDYDMLKFYLQEFYRILKKDGIAIIHHSNLKNIAGVHCEENWLNNSGNRSNVSKEDVCNLAVSTGFEVLEQNCINWGVKDMDCVSVLRKR
ncbi:MAG: class I SAM-dependent methyltransferase [Lachnospiraceae bacterium]|nr:class I SAM-dependent methyltransferase [Lachnospiraceae bacterium]